MKQGMLLGSLLVLVLGGCAPAVMAVRPSSVPRIEPSQIRGPYVPKGTRMIVRLEGEIDTLRSRPGQPITARVLAPLYAPDGRVIVPAGATLRGRLVSVGSPERPRVRLLFESVDTVQGPAPIVAEIEASQHARYPGPTRWRQVPADWYYGGLSTYAYGDLYGWGPWGGGPPGFGGYVWEPYNPREVYLPEGALLRLELDEPLIPPGTRVLPAQ